MSVPARHRWATVIGSACLVASAACSNQTVETPAAGSGASVDAPATTGMAAPAAETTIVTTTIATPATIAATTTSDPWAPKTPYEACLGRAVFGDPAESPYLLPFPPGTGYTVMQTYCTDDGSHESQLAYDFTMPIGSEVTAARAGTVIDVKEDVADEDNVSALNYVLVRHDDGTVAFYAHLTKDGVVPEPGDDVEAGDLIAYSGASGRTHKGGVLHFGVYRSEPRDGRDIAVAFSNSEGLLDERGGLAAGTFYRALPSG